MKTRTSKQIPIQSSAGWVSYFQQNALSLKPISWEEGAPLTQDEIECIIPSLRNWQLGETSDGSHMREAARRYALQYDDPDFVEAARLFILEEQRHGESLGRFLDLAKIPRARSNWGDTVFRKIRYLWPSMEIWVTPVVMVESLAMVYYGAIGKTTQSVVLQQICSQILRDEAAHLRFQCERLAILHRSRSQWLRALTYAMQVVLFTGIALAVWIGHGKALRFCGYRFSTYWARAWRGMSAAWSRMKPERYAWKDTPRWRPAAAQCFGREIPVITGAPRVSK